MNNYSIGFLVKITEGKYQGLYGRIVEVNDRFCNVCISLFDNTSQELRTKFPHQSPVLGATLNISLKCITLSDSTKIPDRNFMGNYINEFIERIFQEFRMYDEDTTPILDLGELYGIITKAKARGWKYKREWQEQFWKLYIKIFAPKFVLVKKPKNANKFGDYNPTILSNTLSILGATI